MSSARCSLKLDRVAEREEGIGVEGGRYVRGHVHMTSALRGGGKPNSDQKQGGCIYLVLKRG